MGVMLGVTVLILVISVMTGFDRELRQKVIDFDAHILVTTETTLTNWRELTEKIRATPRVVATAPFVQGQVIVEHDERRLAPTIRGIDPEEEEKVVTLQKFVKWGKLDLEGDTTVLGVELARELNVRVGDKVTVYSPGNLNEILDRIKKLENAKNDEEKKAIAELREVVLPERFDSHRNLRDRPLCARFSVSVGAAFHWTGTLPSWRRPSWNHGQNRRSL